MTWERVVSQIVNIYLKYFMDGPELNFVIFEIYSFTKKMYLLSLFGTVLAMHRFKTTSFKILLI